MDHSIREEGGGPWILSPVVPPSVHEAMLSVAVSIWALEQKSRSLLWKHLESHWARRGKTGLDIRDLGPPSVSVHLLGANLGQMDFTSWLSTLQNGNNAHYMS